MTSDTQTAAALGQPTTIAGGTFGHAVDASASAAIRRIPVVANRVELISRLAGHSRAVANGYRDVAEESRARYAEEAGFLSRFEAERAAGRPTAQTNETIDLQREKASRAKAAYDSDRAMEQSGIKAMNLDNAAEQTVVRYVSRLLASDQPVVTVPVTLPKGDKSAALAETQGKVAQVLATLKRVKKAAMPEHEAVLIGVGRLDEKIAGAMPRVANDPKDGPRLFWSFAALDDADVSRGVPNLEPLVLKLAYPEIVEHIKSEVARYYSERVELALDAKTKVERIKTLSAELLALERVEVELIIALRAQGSLIPFRAGTDPRALLGVDGPTPSSREDDGFKEVAEF